VTVLLAQSEVRAGSDDRSNLSDILQPLLQIYRRQLDRSFLFRIGTINCCVLLMRALICILASSALSRRRDASASNPRIFPANCRRSMDVILFNTSGLLLTTTTFSISVDRSTAITAQAFLRRRRRASDSCSQFSRSTQIHTVSAQKLISGFPRKLPRSQSSRMVSSTP